MCTFLEGGGGGGEGLPVVYSRMRAELSCEVATARIVILKSFDHTELKAGNCGN